MVRKIGVKKNKVSNVWDYNIGLAGLSGIGKTTVMDEFCNRLLGENGYIYFDIGRESGSKILELKDSPVETCKTWKELTSAVNELISNRTTDYAEVKLAVFDTLDEMFDLAEKEAVRLWNKKNPDKFAESINGVKGGFGKGLDQVCDMVLDLLFSLKEMNISFAVVMHTKTKDVDDPITGQSYQVITANMMQRYFNSVKTKLDVLGVAYINRDIVTEQLKTKDIKGNFKTRNVVAGEARKISFRSDDFNLDSKSRFPAIVSEIDMDADQLIKAIDDAIKEVIVKTGKSVDEVKKEQVKNDSENQKLIKAKEKMLKEEAEIKDGMNIIVEWVKSNMNNNKEGVLELSKFVQSLGYDNPTVIDNIDDLNKVLKKIK